MPGGAKDRSRGGTKRNPWFTTVDDGIDTIQIDVTIPDPGPTVPTVPADRNADGDVDIIDFSVFNMCFQRLRPRFGPSAAHRTDSRIAILLDEFFPLRNALRVLASHGVFFVAHGGFSESTLTYALAFS